jgi:phage FluMu protein Com
MISVNCSQCGKKLTAPDTAAGKRARCPKCKTILTLPAASAEIGMQEEVLDAEPVAGGSPAPPSLEPTLDDLESIATQVPAASGEGLDLPPDDNAGGYDLAENPVAPPTAAPTEAARRPCPLCGELIPVGAAQCRFCKEIFDPTLKKAQRKQRGGATMGEDEDLTTGEWVLAILCSGIGCILGIVWIIQGKPKGKKMLGISFVCAIIWNIVRFAIEAASHGH